MVELSQKMSCELQNGGAVRMLLVGVFLQSHPVVVSHESTLAWMQYRFLTAFLDFELAGAQVDQRVFPILVGAASVISKIARYKQTQLRVQLALRGVRLALLLQSVSR